MNLLRRPLRPVVAASALLAAAVTSPAQAMTWQVASVADSSGPLGTSAWADHALANDNGLAFSNLRDDGQYAIYRSPGNGGPLKLVAETSDTAPGWTLILGGTSTNAAGQTTFNGFRTVTATEGFYGLYRAETNGSFTTLAEVSANQNTTTFLLGTDVNAAGTAAYQRRVVNVSRGIYVGNGATETPAFVGTDADRFNTWAVNNDGQVAIAGTINGVKGVWRAQAGTLTPIATGSAYTDLYFPSIDDAGNVTFTAQLANGGAGVYRGDGTAPVATLADTTANFTAGFTRAAANEAGDVAFLATPSGGTASILYLAAGDDASQAQRIVSIGDAFMGSTINGLVMSSYGINDAGSVAFTYRLSNGIWGNAVAVAPEPAALAALAAPALALAGRRRRR